MQHFPQRILRAASRARLAMKRQNGLLQPEPRHQPSHETVLLAQAAQRHYRPAAEEPEIADIGNQPAIDRPAHEAIKQRGGSPFEPAFPISGDALG